MLSAKPLYVFLSGRIVALPLSLVFQIAVVRLLAPSEYAVVGFAVAVAGLVQALTSLGLPQVFARYLAEAVRRERRDVARRLVFAGMAAHAVLAAAAFALVVSAWQAVFPGEPLATATILESGAFCVAVSVYGDAEAASLALMLQRLSRLVSIAESAGRVGAVALVAYAVPSASAAVILAISTAALLLAAMGLAAGIARATTDRSSVPAEPAWPDYRELRRIAFAGHVGTLAWLAMNAATIRFLAAADLDTATFAGFAFLQGLALSLVRCSPGSVLSPFVQPAVMGRFARDADKADLVAALSLVNKIDLAAIGAAIVALGVAGTPLVAWLTGGRYADLADALPFMLILFLLQTWQRAYDTASYALAVTSGILGASAIGVAWLGILIFCAGPLGLGLWAFLLSPIGDALTKLWVIGLPLRRSGAGLAIDWGHALHAAAAALVLVVVGRAAASFFSTGPVATVALGLAAACLFILGLAGHRPLRRAEAELLASASPRLSPLVLDRFRD
jgi:O-antigen/teichoic acid export membrane protein